MISFTVMSSPWKMTDRGPLGCVNTWAARLF
jgi:hypothetical protein